MDEIKDATWNSIPVHGKTSCEISNVTPNAQYMIQVVLHSEDKNENSIQRKNVVYALIPATSKFSNFQIFKLSDELNKIHIL